jgi:hypothetical protein
VGLEVTTVATHAREWLPVEVEAEARPLPYFAEGFILDGLLRDLSRAGVDALETASSNPAALRPTLEAIRHAGLDAESLRAGAARGRSGAERRLALAHLLEGYERALTEGRYLDGVRTLRMATAEVIRAGVPDATIYGALDETRLSTLEEEFVRALTAGGANLERIGGGTPGLPPPRRSAVALFWPAGAQSPPAPGAGPAAWLGAGEVPAAVRTAMAEQLRSATPPWAGVRRSVGALAEVRDALRDALARGLALDDVEIAYAASTPYLALLHS